ncbi:MAG: DNRLRE domain-containing protein [Candidatus Thorarchaeota archaeon]
MKKYSLILVTLLLFGMVLSTISFTTTNSAAESFRSDDYDQEKTLAVNPDATVSVIRVSDDAFTIDANPDTNYGDFAGFGGILCGNDSTGALARIWMKFDLSHIPNNVQFARATVNLFMEHYFNTADEPFGVYYSENDTWTEDTITWNNEPEYDPTPIDVIDAPSSPNMFDYGNWYEWEITSEVIQTLDEDGMLTLVLAQVDETLSTDSMNGFMSRENSIADGRHTIPNIALEYSIPTAPSGLLVDGYSELPHIDYISSTNPDFGWSSNDADSDDFQKNYELEVWNSSSFDETRLMHEINSKTVTVHDTTSTGVSGPDTFNAPVIWRIQYKWPASMITQSGVVDKLFFEVDTSTGSSTYTDLAIYMQCVDNSDYLDYDYEANYEGRTPIQVLNRSEYTAITEGGFIQFDIENTFTVGSGLSLIIEIRHTGASGTSVQGNLTDSGGSFAAGSGSSAYSAASAGTKADGWTQGLKLALVSTEVLSDGFISNTIPFGVPSDRAYRVQFKFNQSLIDTAGIIDILRFSATGMGSVTYENYRVYLVETPVEGELSSIDMDSNYGGQSPTLVLDRNQYTVTNTGRMLAIDIDDSFYYSNVNDLLIEFRFDSLISGDESIMFDSDRGAYRAFQYTSVNHNDTNSPDLYIDYIHDPDTVTYSGPPLVNATTYYWRVRTCDSLGIWGPWKTASFKYEILTSVPAWSNLILSTDIVELGESMTVSIDVTHLTGIRQVQLEHDGLNHTMSNEIDTFSYSWPPLSTGDVYFTVYMESNSRTWSTVIDGFVVVDTTAPTWITVPADKVLEFGEDLSYQLTATDLSGIANWTISDNTNFEIIDGLVSNRVVLAPGGYHLNITVTDNEGNSISGTFIVAVLVSGTQPSGFGELSWIIPVLIGVIVVLVLVIIIQTRKK